MDFLEAHLSRYPSIISALSAIATASAVIVALYLARRQTKSRLRVFADVSLYISSEVQFECEVIDTAACPRMISVTIQNIGPVSVRVPYFSSFKWSVPLGKQQVWQNPHEPDFRANPIELTPGTSASVVLSHDIPAFITMVEELSAKSRIGRHADRFLRLSIITEVGDKFDAHLGNHLKDIIRNKAE